MDKLVTTSYSKWRRDLRKLSTYESAEYSGF